MNYKRRLAPLSILNMDDLQRIHEASCKVLEQTGMIFQSDKACEILKKGGARVENQRVYITKKMVDDALALCPHTFGMHALNPDKAVVVGEDFLVQPNGGPVFIQDLDNGRRLSKMEDFINIHKLMQNGGVADLAGFSPVDPSDIPLDVRPVHMQYQVLRHTDMPIHGHVCGGEKARQMLDMLKIAHGDEKILEKHVLSGLSINPISPLSVAEDQLETLFAYVENGQAIFPGPLSLGGISAPLSYVGITVQMNAETLGLVVLAQLIRPGTPIVMALASTFAEFKGGMYCSGTPDMGLHMITNIQLVRDLYKLPIRVNAGTNASKAVDSQSGFETMQNLMMVMLTGCHLIHESQGTLDNLMTVSYEKMMIDEELIRRVKYMTREIDVSDEALSVDLINEIGPGGNYLYEESTLLGCRDLFLANVSDWSGYSVWEREGALDIVQRANKIYKERLANAPESILDPYIDKELLNYVRKVENKYGV